MEEMLEIIAKAKRERSQQQDVVAVKPQEPQSVSVSSAADDVPQLNTSEPEQSVATDAPQQEQVLDDGDDDDEFDWSQSPLVAPVEEQAAEVQEQHNPLLEKIAELESKIAGLNNTSMTSHEPNSDVHDLVGSLVTEEFEHIDREVVEEIAAKMLMPALDRMNQQYARTLQQQQAEFEAKLREQLEATHNDISSKTAAFEQEAYNRKASAFISSVQDKLAGYIKDVPKLLGNQEFIARVANNYIPGTDISYAAALSNSFERGDHDGFVTLVKQVVPKSKRLADSERPTVGGRAAPVGGTKKAVGGEVDLARLQKGIFDLSPSDEVHSALTKLRAARR